MPRALSFIPLDVPIVDKAGAITIFFRLLWQALIDGFSQVPTVAVLAGTGLTAALVTTTAFTTTQSGRYRIAIYTEKTVPDGAASTLTVTVGWTRNGLPRTHTFAALATDVAGANNSNLWAMPVDTAAPITVAIAYTSTTPNTMTYDYDVTVEQLI